MRKVEKFWGKVFACIVAIVILFCLCIPVKVEAALQANGSSITQNNLDGWLQNVRKMEGYEGTMGLDDEFDPNTLESTKDIPNNIDIHVEKNTEYGAMVLLATSIYGNPNNVGNNGTTTGNSTGVVMNVSGSNNGEMVVAADGSNMANYFPKWAQMNKRYRNDYDYYLTSKPGDAMMKWHGASFDSRISANSILNRGVYSSDIFSTYASNSQQYTNYWTRAVVVCGEGF